MPFEVKQIDDVIHGRIRLGVIAYLATAEVADFNELKALVDATGGNLSVHLRKLEDAAYVTIEKGFLERKPLTRVRITKAGRQAFLSYLKVMSVLLEVNTRVAPSRRRSGAA